VSLADCPYTNSQHISIDPAIGRAAGFGGVILHGLSTFGFAARALLTVVANGDAKALKFFGVRFTSPVKPGDALETQIWEVGPGPDGTTEVTFITKNLTAGKVSHIVMPVFYQDLISPFSLHSVEELRISRKQLRANYKRSYLFPTVKMRDRSIGVHPQIVAML
jgi:hypothetical protein